MKKIYVASSWRNSHQPAVVQALRADGHDVYDFRNPAPGDCGFKWEEIDPGWELWTPVEFRMYLEDPIAVKGFLNDMRALQDCDCCVLVLPCGRSAHLELGYAIGAGKPTFILLAEGEPELMYKMSPYLCADMDELKRMVRLYGGAS